jgi:hypothetical protein
MLIVDDDWGCVEVARPVPIDDDPWGDFAPLRETRIWELINTVPGEAFADATRGFATPLMGAIGRPPLQNLRKLGQGYQKCINGDLCAMRTDKCVPGPSTPLCFVPDADHAERAEIAHIAAVVIRLWVEGVYFVVVGPGEF